MGLQRRAIIGEVRLSQERAPALVGALMKGRRWAALKATSARPISSAPSRFILVKPAASTMSANRGSGVSIPQNCAIRGISAGAVCLQVIIMDQQHMGRSRTSQKLFSISTNSAIVKSSKGAY